MGVTVKEVLRTQPLGQAVLLVGDKGLMREVTGVSVIEDPDVVNWLKGGELLLTTGYIFRDDPAKLTEFILAMNAQGAAALGIKLKRFLDVLPAETVAVAQNLNFPIFDVPYGCPWSSIITAVLEKVLQYDVNQTVQRVEDRLREQLFSDILFDNLNMNPETLNFKSHSFGIDPQTPKIIFVIAVSGGDLAGDKFPPELVELLKRCLDLHETGWIVKKGTNELIYILDAARKQEELTKQGLLDLAREMNNVVQDNGFGLKSSVGIGRFAEKLENIRQSYLEAKRSLEIGRLIWGCSGVYHYEDLGFYRLIINQTRPEEIQSFCKQHLAPLKEFDDQHGEILIKTLEQYLSAGGNITETAQGLFVHFNTVKYRMARIEEILKIDLKDAEVRFNLQVALKLQRLLDELKNTN